MTKLTQTLRTLQTDVMEARKAWRHGNRQKFATAYDIVEYKLPRLCLGIKLLCDILDLHHTKLSELLNKAVREIEYKTEIEKLHEKWEEK